MNYFWSSTILLGVVLQLLIISSLFRGSFRRFPVLSVYSIVSFLITVAESSAFLRLYSWNSTIRMYWIDEIIIQILVFALVISLVSKALQSGQKFKSASASLSGIALIVIALAIALAYSSTESTNRWMTEASRNLSFASAILNLLLWSVLLSQKNKDAQLMMLSGGFGIQTTGKAMGHSIRSLGFWNSGNVFIVLTYLLSLAIIWFALRKKVPVLAEAAAAVSAETNNT
jgi:hypothetical protein